MKTYILIFLLILLSSEALSEYLFESNDVKKNVVIEYNGNSTLTLSHDFDPYCKGRAVPPAIYETNCTYSIEDAILVTLNNPDFHSSIVIDMFEENGSSPIITSITALDLDLDGNNELYIHVLNQHRHSGPGLSADIIELFAYSSTIKRQADTGTDVKRLYYLEEEFTKLLTNKKIPCGDL